MIQHALDRGYEVVGVCREQSVHKLERFADRISVIGGATDDREVIQRAVAGCDAKASMRPTAVRRAAGDERTRDPMRVNERTIERYCCMWGFLWRGTLCRSECRSENDNLSTISSSVRM